MTSIVSRQVSWWSAHEFITALTAAENFNLKAAPYAGTPAWCALPDDDPRKLLALAAAGEHAVLRWETEQEASRAASHAIAAAADWPGIAQAILAGRGDAYIPRRRSA